MPLIANINQDALLEHTSTVMGAVSLACCVAIILNFLFHEELRTFCFKMICMAVTCQLFCSLSTVMGHVESPLLCGIQATMRAFFQMSLVLWTLAITFTIYITVTKQRMGVERYFMSYNVGIWITSSVLTILPVLTQSYGRDFDNMCWITDENIVSKSWQWIQFYGPLWISYLFIIWMYIKIESGLKLLTIRTQVYLVNRLRKYPFVVFVAYLYPSIHRILLDLSINSMTLNMLHKISVHSGGILYFMLFISSPHVRATNMSYMNWCFNKLKVIHMSPEERKEKTLENPLSFDSDEENERPSTTAESHTKSEKIAWTLNPTSNTRAAAALTTAAMAYGEMGLHDIELSKVNRNTSVISAISTKSISHNMEQTEATDQGEHRVSDSTSSVR
eukprot:132419_1